MLSKELLFAASMAMTVPNSHCQDLVQKSKIALSPVVSDGSHGNQSLFSARNITMVTGAAFCIGGLFLYRRSLCRWATSLFSPKTNNTSSSNQPEIQPIDSKELFDVAQRGDINRLKVLLQHRADCNIINCYSQTPLHIVARAYHQNHVNMAEKLLLAGAEVESADPSGTTPLMVAASCGNVEMVSLLLKNEANVNAVDVINKRSPLMHATLRVRAAVVLVLLKARAQVNATSITKSTPLHYAATSWFSDTQEERSLLAKVIKALLASGANVEAVDKWGQTPLMRAIACNNKTVVSLLK